MQWTTLRENKHISGYESLAVSVVLMAVEDYKLFKSLKKPVEQMSIHEFNMYKLTSDAGKFLESETAKIWSGLNFNIKAAIDDQDKNDYEKDYERIKRIYLNERRK